MMRTGLLEIVGNGENSGVEFKRDVLENHGLAKELVANGSALGRSIERIPGSVHVLAVAAESAGMAR